MHRPALVRSALALGASTLLGSTLATTAAVAAAAPATAELPLKRIVLFNSGVGYFEHDGQLTGDARVEFKFRTESINDLLKSMVVEDLGGGRISAVSYGSKDPITKTLKSFALDLTTNPTMADLLAQARGEQVEVEAPNKIVGLIVGVEKRPKAVGDEKTIEVDYLNLLCDEGLRSVGLDTVARIRLTNPQLDAEFRKALALLATSHATDKKSVSLDFLGQGSRRARVGYIQETPVWKTSYRLVLEDDKKPLLQGWAIVENTTEADWSGVQLTLVSGRPISFVMDLYQPLYVPRPEVQMELYSSLRPQVYGQDLARREAEFQGRKLAESREPLVGYAASGPAPAAPAPARSALVRNRALLQGGAVATPGLAEASDRLNLALGGQSMAQAGNVGELFQYRIQTPVSIVRQQSAMLPIVNEEVQGEKVSIYDPNVQAKHPLNGLRLTNSTKLHLMQGPVTVFDDSMYAGDARIEDLAPGSQRLLSYALDLDTEVAVEKQGKPRELVSVRLAKGTMLVTNRSSRTTVYTIKNSGRKAKTVLLEYPLDPEWRLLEPAKPAEKTRDKYRFDVKAAPGTPAQLTVSEERVEREHVALTNLDDGMIVLYSRAPQVSAKVKAALAELAKRKAELNLVTRKRQELETQLRQISEEQTRIRQNMAAIDRNGDLYNRYVKKFTEQEDQVEAIRRESAGLLAKEQELRKALDEYLLGLDVE